MTKKIVILSGIIVLIIVFLLYGRSIYMPLFYTIKGKETVDSRIEQIQEEVRNRLAGKLNKAGYVVGYPKELILAAFKEEQILQVYAKDNNGVTLITQYPFTAYSGKLGPKLIEGDRQIPEGVYNVEYLNPNSSYYLSIKVSFPNEFDKSKTTLTKTTSDLGGDIFIHGKAVTIGCIPIGDQAIEEVFVLVHKAMNNNVKVIISPRDFRIHPSYPKIEGIDWENELYDTIKDELKMLPKSVDER